MKQLLIRNFKLRSWTLALYILLLVINPIYAMIIAHTTWSYIIYIPVAIALMLLSILDSGHLFRIHRRLGGKSSHIFYESLPVSKKDMLNANYITCIVLTLFGALIIGLYNFQATNIEINDLRYSTAISFVYVNFFSIPIAFQKNTVRKSEHISYAVYIISMMLVIPFTIALVFTATNTMFLNNALNTQLYAKYINYGLLLLSVLCMILNYIIQFRHINQRIKKEGFYEAREHH
ncbi:ABC-2 transporter permease [Staphylococcus sp. NRL 16/872]|uniref:phenol-soluble modulin export ABC transporter permease subunit PmtB n=1 Tax=Staphylococcus sp. NRL 16/872 TaxID=2930131 RepID=UPI001FB20531|nr:MULTISPECIES: ABC-2 transporter permease [unclassified Staphylococcus]MCJ1655981.1 ABC-2 transporter permease [Staphylococcus sp. NRL 21/187]MCJ1661774.1 ABC-2 transporter permease [Staphylococcus sp. NRL 18/288]MCJ1667717.1 ABC-2 transporter permease [Staphylococcus sp. NRL 19/737]WEN70207.1 ABC-2 transporter permease [Staphylococcus sp. NRL 16/872]